MAFENEEEYLNELLKSMADAVDDSDVSNNNEENTLETSIQDTEVDEYIQNLLMNGETDDVEEQEAPTNNEEESDDWSFDNDLINQLGGIIEDIQNGIDEKEEEVLDGDVEFQEDSVDSEQIDYSALDIDDEIKDLFGIENAEELDNIESNQKVFTEEEIDRINSIEEENLFNDNLNISEEETIIEEEDSDLGIAELMNKVSDAGIAINSVEPIENQGQLEVSKKEVEVTKRTGLVSKILGIFGKNKNQNLSEGDVNENQKVLDTLFDENGELVEKEKKTKKKSLFSWMSNKETAATTEKREAIEDIALEGIADIEEIPELKKKKEPKQKKEKTKKEKKAKPAKKKAAPKPKIKKEKIPVDPSELMKVKPAAILWILLVTAGIAGASIFFITTFTYNLAYNEALAYLNEHKYTFAYEAIAGVEAKNEADAGLVEQIETIMQVQRVYNAHEAYKKMNMEFEALDVLISGFRVYDENYDKALELGVDEEVNEVKALFAETLLNNYGITEEMARIYAEIEDYQQYVYILESYGGTRG